MWNDRFGFLGVMVIVLCACAVPTAPPKDAAAVGAAQARVSSDSSQIQLWEEAARSGALDGIEAAHVSDEVVKRRKVPEIPNRPAEAARVAFPETLASGMVVRAAPELEEEFSGTAKLLSAEGEFLDLDLGQGRTLSLQTKVAGNPLRVKQGETATLLYRRGDPFERNDLVALKLDQDDLVYALVGSKEPVRLNVPTHSLSATQTGKPMRNSMSVEVTVGDETLTLEAGEEKDFPAGGLTVFVLASVAVQGEAAHVLPGQPYRLELLAWRLRNR